MENLCGPLWNPVLDTDKLIFLNDKMLASFGEETFLEMVNLCESMMIGQAARLGEKSGPFVRALAVALTRPIYTVRQRASSVVKKLLANGIDYSIALIRELTVFMQDVKIVTGSRNREEGDSSATAASVLPLNEVDVHSLVACLQTITAIGQATTQSCDKVAVACFKAAHHPAVVVMQPLVWYYIIKAMSQVPKTVVKRCYTQLKEDLIKNHEPGVWAESCLGGLARLNPDETIKDVLDTVNSVLSRDDLLRITNDEYFTYLAPEGQLYDRTVLENTAASDVARNIKRESRVYSYKEQMEELQLIRELEEKKKREGKIKEPELNPKQKEAIRVQLEKESAIRSKVAVLTVSVNQVCSMLNAVMEAVPSVVSNHLTRLIPWILKAMASPVAAPLLIPVWIGLSKSAELESAVGVVLANSIAHTTLRLVKPLCDPDAAWEKESLESAARRILGALFRASSCLLDAATFTYTFPFIRETIKLVGTKEETVMTQGIQLIQRHAGLRSATRAENNPRLLPLKEMIELLIDIIATTTNSRVQQTAYAALLEVAVAASGQPGCAVVADDEITCFLDGLESSVESVRDVCLHCLTALLHVLNRSRPKGLTSRLTHRRNNKNNNLQFNFLIFNSIYFEFLLVWSAKFDVVPEIREQGEKLWTTAQLPLNKNISELLMADVGHMVEAIRAAGAEALASALQLNTAEVDPSVKRLLKLYNDRLNLTPPVVDKFGREVEPAVDIWQPRAGVGLALYRLVPLIDEAAVVRLSSFFVPKGLGDRHEAVQKNMLMAAVAMIDQVFRTIS